jgi:hypothetical protein
VTCLVAIGANFQWKDMSPRLSFLERWGGMDSVRQPGLSETVPQDEGDWLGPAAPLGCSLYP